MKAKRFMKVLLATAAVVASVGALNWGLIGLFDFNLVTKLFGAMPWLVRTIYVVAGVGGAMALYAWSSKLLK